MWHNHVEFGLQIMSVNRRNSYLTAIAIAMLIGVWLLSGPRGSNEPPPPTLADQAASRDAIQADRRLIRVRGKVIHASPQVRYVRIRGKTEYKRTVIARAEITATVVARPVERGTRVAAGDALCRLSVDDRELALAEAEAALNQAEIEHQASLRLGTEGLQSETLVAQAEARLAGARTRLRRSQLDLARTEVRAPYDGVVEDVHLEAGDYATPGSPCVTLVELDPILLVGRVPERGRCPGLRWHARAGQPGSGRARRGLRQLRRPGQRTRDPFLRSGNTGAERRSAYAQRHFGGNSHRRGGSHGAKGQPGALRVE